MAAVTLISRPSPTQIGTLVVDAVLGGGHTFAAEVTQHPVEEGADIADHTRPQPTEISLECVVSNTPLGASETRTVEQNRVQFTSTAPEFDPKRTTDAYRALIDFRDTGTLLTVVTPLDTFEDLVITSVAIPVQSPDGLRFTVALRKIRIVKNKLTRVVVARDTRAGGKVKTGQQTPKQVQAPERLQSIGAIGEDVLGRVFGVGR